MQGAVFLRLLAVLVLSAVVVSPAAAQGVLNGGFLGSYYANAGFSGAPSFQRRDVRIDFTWPDYGAGGSSSPEYAGVGAQVLSVSWTGQIMPATSETYSFALAASGGGVTLAIRPT